jgi:hypothetical protein
VAVPESALPRVSPQGRRTILQHLAEYRELVRLVIDGERELAAGEDAYNTSGRSEEAVQHGIGDPVSIIAARRAALAQKVAAASWWVRAIDDVMAGCDELEREFVVVCWIDCTESYTGFNARLGITERGGDAMRERLLRRIAARAGVS